MPEPTFNNHRTATRTPGPMQSGSLPIQCLYRDTTQKTVLPKRSHSQVLLQSRFSAARRTRLSNSAARVSSAAPDNYRAKRWGSLRRVRMSDNSYRWLCKDHAK